MILVRKRRLQGSCFFEELGALRHGKTAYNVGCPIRAWSRKMENDCVWDEDTLISFTEDDTIFGPDGVWGWLANIWCKVMA